MHVASPFPRNAPKSEDELIRPAVDGTLRVLRAAADAGVKRVVMTSSVVAVSSGHHDEVGGTEADWSDVDRSTPYSRSKTLAELAAWDFADAVRCGAGGGRPGHRVRPGARRRRSARPSRSCAGC